MYDFYPEWGPARNRDDAERPSRRPRYWRDRAPVMAGAGQGAPEARDDDRDRPDDN